MKAQGTVFKYGDNVSVNAALHRMTEDRGNYMGSTVDYTTGELTGGYKGYSVEEVKDTSGNIIDSKIPEFVNAVAAATFSIWIIHNILIWSSTS